MTQPSSGKFETPRVVGPNWERAIVGLVIELVVAPVGHSERYTGTIFGREFL